MQKIIAILKANGFFRTDTKVYANDNGICVILYKKYVAAINPRGETVGLFLTDYCGYAPKYALVGLLHSIGQLKDGYKLKID